MKKYPKYKTSGVEWIGEIPEKWEVKALKHLANVMPSNIDKKSQDDEKKVFLCNYVDVYKNDFITNEMSFMEATASDSQIEKFTLQKGDVIATKDSEDSNDIAIPALVSEDFSNVVCGYHLTLMRSNDVELIGRYLFWLMYSKNYNHYFSLEANGVTRYGIGTYSFKNLRTLLPSIPEQTQIANYLDYKTNEIETLISNKQKLIELLQEERTATINQAVTKGVPSNLSVRAKSRTKPSGIEWLGDIPEHWEVKKLKYVVESVKTGSTPPSDNIEYFEPAEIDWFTPSDFKQLMLSDSRRKISAKAVEEGKCKMYPKHSVLLIGIGATLGKLGIISEPASSNQQINAIVFDEAKMNPFFGAYFLNSFSDIIVSMSSAATLAILNQTQTKDLLIVTPSLEEQNQICAVIEKEELRINTIIAKTEQEIELLKEYKTALISEVVTGKVDVREEKF